MKPLEIKGARARLGYKQQYMADNLGIEELMRSMHCGTRSERWPMSWSCFPGIAGSLMPSTLSMIFGRDAP